MTGLVRGKYLALLLLCLNLGCGGGGGSRGGPPILNPVPTLTEVTPNSAAAGSASTTITASGSGFVRSSVVEWNGTALTTTYVSSTSLTAKVPPSNLSTPGTATLDVQSRPPGGGKSGAVNFTIQSTATKLSVINVEGNDLVWDPNQQKFYVAVPSSAASNPGTITIVDPVAASIVSSQPLSSAPSGLAISDNSQYLYAVINGALTIQLDVAESNSGYSMVAGHRFDVWQPEPCWRYRGTARSGADRCGVHRPVRIWLSGYIR